MLHKLLTKTQISGVKVCSQTMSHEDSHRIFGTFGNAWHNTTSASRHGFNESMSTISASSEGSCKERSFSQRPALSFDPGRQKAQNVLPVIFCHIFFPCAITGHQVCFYMWHLNSSHWPKCFVPLHQDKKGLSCPAIWKMQELSLHNLSFSPIDMSSCSQDNSCLLPPPPHFM